LLYEKERQLVKHLLIVLILNIATHSICMEIEVSKKNPTNLVDLLENNGAYLKKLIAVENNGIYSPDLYTAQQALQTFFAVKADFPISCDAKTLKLAQRIAQREQDYRNVYQALAKYDYKQAQSIINKNKYCLNYANNESLLSSTTDSSIVEFLIALGANVNQKNFIGQTPLFDQIGNSIIRPILLSYGARINDTDDKGNTILHDVLECCFRLREIIKVSVHHEKIDFLLSQGANPEIGNKASKTSFDLIDEYKLAMRSIFEPHGYVWFHTKDPVYIQPYELLKNNAAYLKKLVDTSQAAELYRAIQSLVFLFNYCKKQDKRSDHYVSSKGILISEKMCLFKHASLQDCNALFGKDALAYATEVVKTKPIVKKNLKTLLYAAADDGDVTALKNIFEVISINNKRLQDTILRGLIKNHDDESLRCCLENGFTAEGVTRLEKPNLLELAIHHNNPKGVQLLIDYGYDLYQINNALEESIVRNNKECTEILQKGLERFFIDALKEHSCAKVKLLLKAGIDLKEALICTRDYQWYLAKGKCEACARLLVDYKG
jgi:hypothetical protein